MVNVLSKITESAQVFYVIILDKSLVVRRKMNEIQVQCILEYILQLSVFLCKSDSCLPNQNVVCEFKKHVYAE